MATPSAAFLPRVNFGRRLEPTGNIILHGAGQSPEAFQNYWAAVAGHKPLLYMSYVSFKDDLPQYFQRLQSELATYAPYILLPQIGLFMNGGGLAEHEGPHYE